MTMEIEALRLENQQLKEALAAYKKEILSHKSENLFLRRFFFGLRSEKIKFRIQDINQIDLFTEDLLCLDDLTNQEAETNSSPRKKRHPSKNRAPLPSFLERNETVIDLPEEMKACPCCGETMNCIGQDVSEKLEVAPVKFSVRRTLVPKYCCKKHPEQGVFCAKTPSPLIKGGMAGASVLAQVMINKYCDHLPLERQSGIFARSGIQLSKSTLSDWMGSCHKVLQPLLNALQSRMLTSDLVQADETTFMVQNNSKSAAPEKGYMWCFTGDKNWVWYEWRQGRAKHHPSEILKDYGGKYLQCDGYAGYNHVVQEKGLIRQGCMAHARRKFVESLDMGEKSAKAFVELFAELYMVAKDLEDLDEIRTLRQTHGKALLEKIHALATATNLSATPKSRLGKACTYFLSEYEGLCVYLDHPELEIDNNRVERSMRRVAMGRKNFLFAGSPNGAKWAAGFYSLIETAKAFGVEPWEYLSAVLEWIPTKENVEDLLPDKYSEFCKNLSALN